MSYVTIFWSGAAAAALLLCIIHTAVWIQDRNAHPSLALAIIAVSLTGIAFTELHMMLAQSAQDWAFWVRWCHLPLFIHFAAIVFFVRLYLGTGRTWLMWTIVAMRLVIVIVNFLSDTNFNFVRVDAIGHIRFLGEQVAVVTSGQTSFRQWFATLSNLLVMVYVIDAAAALWRRNRPDDRHKAVVVSAGIVIFLLLSVMATQLVIWGVVVMPMLITPPFLISLSVLAVEMGRDTLRAGRLANTLRESEDWRELAADASQLGFWTWDSRHNAIWATERSRTLFGLDPQEPISLDMLRSRVHADDIDHIGEVFRRAIDRDGDYSVQFRCHPPQGPCRWISSQGEVEFGPAGRPVLVRGVLRDISDQKQAEQEAAELRRALTHAGRVTMLGQLASALAHELSQPLGAILRNAEAAAVLLRSPSPDIAELREIVSDIEKDDRRAGDVIDRLRALLKRRELQMQPMSIDSLVRDASTLVRADAAARHVSLECHADESLPLVSADRVHLLQVLINLIVNAVDATCDIRNARRCVRVAAQAAGRTNVEICVTDSGTGISQETLPRIFEPFFTTKTSGMGMGLAVSRTIIEAHGGRLWAENGSTGGAIFHMTLPAIQEAPT
ncbi:MAG TPA: ATP-binding protein [Povalibacter sp.]|uniref:sensor histidine kinase n=1 Tax=Povalibacter sp. TaxID=1962978 RepID=UPI002B794ACF|nr:ATP-binding protein [Povalibacter sp.]HMN45518.1 ATP-binding protein [Povalibacter sp.]